MAELFRRRRLPHWEKPNATYFVTACLAGSIPSRGLLSIRRSVERASGLRPVGDVALRRWQRARDRQAFIQREHWLDACPCVRWFADERLARLASDAIRFHAGIRYDLHAFVVMPSHIHCVISPRGGSERSLRRGRMSELGSITHSLKSFIAHEARRVAGFKSEFWQQESYDHLVRNEEELERIVRYVEHNPVKAGLCRMADQWEFSSAAPPLPP